MNCNKFSLILLSILSLSFIAIKADDDEFAPSYCRKKEQCKRGGQGCTRCWCSFQCSPRTIKPDDELIYVENDPYGHNCYCKQRDLDYVTQCGLKNPSAKNVNTK